LSELLTKSELGRQLQKLEHAVTERLAAEQAIEAEFGSSVDPREQELAAQVTQRQSEHEQALAQLAAEHQQRRREINERCDAHQQTAAEQRRTARNLVERQAAAEVAEVTQKYEDSRWVAQSVLDETAEESPKRQLERFTTQLAKSEDQQRTSLEAVGGQVADAMHEHNWSRPAPPPPDQAPRKLGELAEHFAEAIDAAQQQLTELRQLRIPRLFEGMRPLWLFVVLLAAIAGPAWLLVDPSLVGVEMSRNDAGWFGIVAGAALLTSLLVMGILYAWMSMQLSEAFSGMQEDLSAADFYHQRWQQAAEAERLRKQKEFDARQKTMEEQLGGQLQRFETAHRQTLEQIDGRRATDVNQIEADFRQREQQIALRREQELQAADSEYQTRVQDLTHQFESDRARRQEAHDQYVADRMYAHQSALRELSSHWNQALQSVALASAAAAESSQEQFAAWKALSEPAWQPPTKIPLGIRIGEHAVDFLRLPGGRPDDDALLPQKTGLPFPAILPFPDGASLLMKTDGPQSRRAALQAMQVYLLRMLTKLPPGKLRLTIFDPVGLGESFSGLMHLADYDELLITSRIWTETAPMEARLADLTEHMENILQKYLRNEFSSIEAYNEFAGEVAEPYHVLVVADFPHKFSEQAARRLTSIATSGPRCGVYMLMSADPAQPTPHGFDLADIQAAATTLCWHAPQAARAAGDSAAFEEGAGDLYVDDASERSAASSDIPAHLGEEPAFYLESDDPALSRWPIVLDEPPSPEIFTQIVKNVGEASKDVRRVEVSFQRIAPPPDDLWSRDSRAGIDVPLGRAGATKLQHLRLGKGTSQHMLVAGKTGSGKSTFFHALITNAALYYSPDELEFYLVDFKKGVEFKAYAGGRLPHARVIAIESDREFGISVLQRLDRILHERGELFRKLGVQDIAGARDALRDASSGTRDTRLENGETTAHPASRITHRETRLPRILLVIDEFQEFFVEDDRYSQQAALLLDRLVRQGRAFGIHVILGSQTLGGAYSLARSTLGQVAVRVALQCSEADAHLILSEANTAARLLTRPGEAIYNDSNGTIEGNHPFQIAWLPDEERAGYLAVMQHFAQERGMQLPQPLVFEGNIPSDPARNDELVALIRDAGRGMRDAAESRIPDPAPHIGQPASRIWLGDAVEIGPPTAASFPQHAGSHLLLVGQDPQSAAGILATGYLALAAQVEPPAADDQASVVPRLWIFDGSHVGSPEAEFWKQLASVRPNTTRIVTPGNLTAALADLTSELDRREAADHARPLYVIVSNLSRFRDLRKAEDDYGFAGFGSSDTPRRAEPSRQFADLLARGPEHGMHVLAWVDSANNLDRWLSRQSLKEFEQRVLFAMNAGDSSQLIESPAAAKLGPHRALLYREETGTTTKFRPYGPPSEQWLQQVRAQLTAAEVVESVQDLDGFQVS
jgi:DNA segregation ATPase FtsK/SpoIIIE, S-DNA-T family